jgi:replicative DNA helicase
MKEKLEIEQSILSAIICNNKAFDKCLFLKPYMFSGINQEIFYQIDKLINAGKTADIFSITLRSEDQKKYLRNIAASMASIYNTDEYASYLLALYQKEQATLLVDTTKQALTRDGVQGIGEIYHDLVAGADKIFGISCEQDDGIIDEALNKAAYGIEQAFKTKGEFDGIKSGIALLDYKIGGFRGDELTVLAGRSGMGKTSIALNFMLSAVKQNKKVCFFSLEMSKVQLLNKLVCMRAGIEAEQARVGKIEDWQMKRVAEATRDMQDELRESLFIFDRPSLTVEQIKGTVRTMIRKKKCDIVFIDHLHLIGYSETRDNETTRLARITAALKGLTKEFNIPVVLLCQLNRAVESQEDKRPSLKDLRGSGSIEQDAEQVIFIYRQEYYIARNKPEDESNMIKMSEWDTKLQSAKNKATLIIDKNRNGSVGKVDIFMDIAINRIGNLEVYGGKYD